MNVKALQFQLRQFRDERDWKKFHTPQNLAQALAVEAGELLECFLWGDEWVEELDHIAEESADVLIYLLQLADACGVDLDQAVRLKMQCNAVKYPVQATLFQVKP